MPRRTLRLIVIAIIVSVVCHQRAARNPFGRYFSDIIAHIDREYIHEVNDQDLFNSAVEGMVASQLDPHSHFFPRREAAEFQKEIEQQFAGVGVILRLDPETKRLTVESPIGGSPAQRAGVLAGDRILAINGQNAAGMTIDDAQQRFQGTPGEPLNIEVEHADGVKQKIELKRAIITVDSVLGDTRDKNGHWDFLLPGHERIGYIRVTQFGDRTLEEFKAAMADITARQARGLILDLRENPGGRVDVAVEMCELFLQRGDAIVSERGRDQKVRQQFSAEDNGPYLHLPLVVLVDRNSASASEIVAACLQDHHRALIVGERSYGKGTVQNMIKTEGGASSLKLTVSTFWRPSGKNIHRTKENEATDDWGVKPDDGLEVKATDDELEARVKNRRRRDVLRPAGQEAPAEVDSTTTDPQLQKAMEALEAELAKKE